MVAKCGTCEADKSTKHPESGAAFQDATYGKGMRVQNAKPIDPKAPDIKCVCTVCGSTNTVAKGAAK